MEVLADVLLPQELQVGVLYSVPVAVEEEETKVQEPLSQAVHGELILPDKVVRLEQVAVLAWLVEITLLVVAMEAAEGMV